MKQLAAALALLTLSGCISLTAKAPPSLLTLAPEAQVPLDRTQTTAGTPTITIYLPVVPQAIATGRVPVQSTNTSIAYLKDAQWVESPQRLFARLLADTVTARTGRVVLGTRQALGNPGAELYGELRDFGVDATTHEAVVTFDATLARGAAGTFEKRRFEARVAMPRIDAAAAGPAISQAANQVVDQVADWIGK